MDDKILGFLNIPFLKYLYKYFYLNRIWFCSKEPELLILYLELFYEIYFFFFGQYFVCKTDCIVKMWDHVCVYVRMRMVVGPSFNLSYAIFDYCVPTLSCCAQTAFSHCPWWIPSLKWRYNIYSMIIMVEDTFYGNFTDYDIFQLLIIWLSW